MSEAPLPRLRPAVPDDLGWILPLAGHPSVARTLAPGTAERVRCGLAGDEGGDDQTLVVELAGQGSVGMVRVVRRAPLHRISSLHSLMLDPEVRGRGLGTATLRALIRYLIVGGGEHRLEGEVYGFNAPALAAFDRAGFTREGVRRSAYFRAGEWHDGVLFALLAEDIGERQMPPRERPDRRRSA